MVVSLVNPTSLKLLECTRISAPTKATPHQVKAEVWMSLIHGSRGLIYFVHEWKPRFNAHALLDDAEMLAAVTALNRQIAALAPVLNSSPAEGVHGVKTSDPAVPIALTHRRFDGATYVFAVAMRPGRATGTFTVPSVAPTATVEVIGEARKIALRDGLFDDSFDPYGVHLYRIR